MRSTPLAGSAELPGAAAQGSAARRLGPACAWATGLVAMLSAGCGPAPCDRSAAANPPVIYAGGTVEHGVYMSSAWDGDDDGDGEVEEDEGLLRFPGGMRYAIKHRLGARPRVVQIYLSFDRDGTKSGRLALAAGNQAEVRVDEETITVVNGSCSEYWLLVVASTGDPGAGASSQPPVEGDSPEGSDESPAGAGGSPENADEPADGAGEPASP